MMPLKAYIGHLAGDDWCILVHGENRGKAKSRFMRCEPIGEAEFPDIRLQRLPGQDDQPFTYDTSKAAGFEYDLEGDEQDEDLARRLYNNFCDCELCKGR